MSLNLFCEKLFSIKNPSNSTINFKINMKNKKTSLEDIFNVLITIFMYGIMILKDKDEINISEIDKDDFNYISKYINILGFAPILEVYDQNTNIKKVLCNEDIINDKKLQINNEIIFYNYTVSINNLKYILKFDYYLNNKMIKSKCL